MAELCDMLLMNARTHDAGGKLRNNQTVAIAGGKIIGCGRADEILFEGPRHDCQGRLLTSGLIDCHTHLVFAGSRSNEFKLRLEGKTYTEIALQGGGILSTVHQTRLASHEELFRESLPRMLSLRGQGVTTVEIKSGYGLDLKTEIKMLEVARELGRHCGMRVKTTFLGAHALPPEYADKRDAYVTLLCEEMMPAVAALKLADAVDVFCEKIAFSLAETERIFLKAHSLGLPVKCHAEQLSNMGGSRLAAEMGALSCDHIEFLDREAAEKMAAKGTVAVILPGAYYFLSETKKPPVALLRALGIPMAIATDCNPGSSPTTSIQLMMSMACHFFGLTPDEAWAGVTRHAARALGVSNETGAVKPGMAADLVLWDTTEAADLCYHFGGSFPHSTMIGGQWI